MIVLGKMAAILKNSGHLEIIKGLVLTKLP
jgi:hypothetical protein